MKSRTRNYVALSLLLSISALLTNGSITSAQSPDSNVISKGLGGLAGAASGAIQGGIAGANAGAHAGSNTGSVVAGDGNPMTASSGGQRGVAVSSGPDGATSVSTDGGVASTGSGASSLLSGVSSSASADSRSSLSESGSTSKPFLEKISDTFNKGKENIKEAIEEKKESFKETLEKKKESFKESLDVKKEQFKEKKDELLGTNSQSQSSSQKSPQNNQSPNSMNQQSQSQQGEKKKDEGIMDKMSRFINKGAEKIQETVHRVEDKASEIGEKVQKNVDENLFKPMQSVSGSGHKNQEGQQAQHANAISNLKGQDREKYLTETKKKQEAESGKKSNSLKDIVSEAKSHGTIPQNEDRSVLKGNRGDEKSTLVEVLDKAHEMSKIPVEKVLKPIDKMLGYEKDPMLRIYDNSHEILKKPISMMAKPVESVFNGAFKTAEEDKRASERQLSAASEKERKEAKAREQKSAKENRTVVGEIADKTVELASKPFEIVLKPIDHAFGFDKDGKKNPLLQILDEVYKLSKKPVDKIARPFENVLKKMADGEQLYQVSVRVNGQEQTDPKLFTRLADGALNIADRVLTKPLEIVLKPLNHALGYDEPGKKNPIVEAAHQLKNATRVGVELFTKPIDRIIKEISELGEIEDEAEREAEYQRKRDEASRIVKALDKLHATAQAPFELVLRPVSKVLGTNKKGRKEPLLRAWDIIHQVLRTPIQVISKPVEDAILGEQPLKMRKDSKKKNDSKINNKPEKKEHQANVFVDGIKKVERIAVKPIDVVTSPLRRLILGEDDEKVGSPTDKNNREIQSKAKGKSGVKSKQPDKIVKTIENMNNVILQPLAVITQPLSDVIKPAKGKGNGKGKGKDGQDDKGGQSGQSNKSDQGQIHKEEKKVETKVTGQTKQMNQSQSMTQNKQQSQFGNQKQDSKMQQQQQQQQSQSQFQQSQTKSQMQQSNSQSQSSSQMSSQSSQSESSQSQSSQSSGQSQGKKSLF